jgi:hypothetical protein
MKTTAIHVLLFAMTAVGCYCAGHVHGTRESFQHAQELLSLGVTPEEPEEEIVALYAVQ